MSGSQNLLSGLSSLIDKDGGIKTQVTVKIGTDDYMKLGATIVGSIWIGFIGTQIFKMITKK